MVEAVDAMGNPIILGVEYCCMIYGPKAVETSKRYGIATEALSDPYQPLVKLEMTRVELFHNGHLVRSSNNIGRYRHQTFDSRFVIPALPEKDDE